MCPTLDDIYAVWPAVNKQQPTWTYFFFNNGIKGDTMTRDITYYDTVGTGISPNQFKIIQKTIQSF